MLSTLGKIFSRQHFEIFLFFPKTGFDISVCMKYEILICGESKKNINLSSAELAERLEKVNLELFYGRYSYNWYCHQLSSV